VGNTNGIFVGTGVQGNIFRRNVVVGNPAIQVSVDHSSNNGYDIQSLATPGANAFEGNTCVTALNAPCPSTGPSLTANPNPIPVAAGARVGQTTISWSAPDVQFIEIHVDSPNGTLFTLEGNRGSLQTGVWVAEGTTFYLQDVSGGKPLTADYTLATLVVHLQTSASTGAATPGFPTWPRDWRQAGAIALVLLLGAAFLRRGSQRRRLAATVGGAAIIALILQIPPSTNAQSQPSPQQTAAALDRMIAAHKTQQELAQYVFDTQGCKSCHTVGQNGKLGFTSRGQQAAGNFEGCVRLLTDVSTIAKIPESRRSGLQLQKSARFKEYGCTFCHQVAADKVVLTQVGAKLRSAHAGCVDVETHVARR
jgi:cytochrome c551/c552